MHKTTGLVALYAFKVYMKIWINIPGGTFDCSTGCERQVEIEAEFS